MKILFSLIAIAFILFCKISFGQITLEHTYDHGASGGIGGHNNQLTMVNFESYGMHYVKIDRTNNEILIYDLNHNLTKTIVPPDTLFNFSDGLDYVLYLSQNLFDTDEGIEYMLGVLTSDNYGAVWKIYILDEDGTILFSVMNQFPWVLATIPAQQFPIYNTPEGAKMILSGILNDSAYVYSLPGTLATAIEEVNNNYISNLTANKIFPNPASSQATIEIQLSTNDLPATLKVFDLNGNEVTKQRILAATNSIEISTLKLPAGVYYYDIENSEHVFTGKKFVVAH